MGTLRIQLHKGNQEITSVQRATFPGQSNELGSCCKEVEVQDCVLDVYKTWTGVHGPPHGPGPWTTRLGLSFVVHVGNVGNMEEGEKRRCRYFTILDVPLQIQSYLF